MLNLQKLFEYSFQTNSDGGISFYPLGKMGKGYIVPSDEIYRELQEFLVKTNAIGFMIGIPFIYSKRLEYCFLYILAFSICNYFLIRKKTRGLEISNEKYRSKTAFKKRASELSFAFLVFGFLFCIVFSFAGLIVALDHPWLGLLCIIFFLSFAVIYLRMIFVKISDRK